MSYLRSTAKRFLFAIFVALALFASRGALAAKPDRPSAPAPTRPSAPSVSRPVVERPKVAPVERPVAEAEKKIVSAPGWRVVDEPSREPIASEWIAQDARPWWMDLFVARTRNARDLSPSDAAVLKNESAASAFAAIAPSSREHWGAERGGDRFEMWAAMALPAGVPSGDVAEIRAVFADPIDGASVGVVCDKNFTVIAISAAAPSSPRATLRQLAMKTSDDRTIVQDLDVRVGF